MPDEVGTSLYSLNLLFRRQLISILIAMNIRDKNITPEGMPGTINNIILGVMLNRLKYVVKLLKE
jgi:hypothetical protein